jgi:hypothetical protein
MTEFSDPPLIRALWDHIGEMRESYFLRESDKSIEFIQGYEEAALFVESFLLEAEHEKV